MRGTELIRAELWVHKMTNQETTNVPICTERQVWSEEELIAAAQHGVGSALEELLIKYLPMVYRVARRFASSPQEAGDLVQETALRVLRNIENFRGEARFSSWLVAIAVNTAISVKRKENLVHWVYLDEPLYEGDGKLRADSLPDLHQNPEDAYLSKEHRILLERAISKQHPKFRLMLRWCDLDEIPIEQVARKLGITDAAAKSRLFRARRMLEKTAQREAQAEDLIWMRRPPAGSAPLATPPTPATYRHHALKESCL